jgi:DNA polymerase-1
MMSLSVQAGKGGYYDVPLDRLAEYAAEDADITLRLRDVFGVELARHGQQKLFREVEMPLLQVLADMEKAGVLLDRAHFARLSLENSARLRAAAGAIYELAGGEFNLNSTRELGEILFEKLGLRKVKKTKTGYSTDITVLEALQHEHPVIRKIIEYRTLSKLQSTYIDVLPGLINPESGRLHTSFNQAVVATGRLSSSDPNLQNIPARDEFGRTIRKGFVAPAGAVLLSADYSQIELRLAAHLSGDSAMQRAFREGRDIHNLTAASVFGVREDDVTPDMRRQAKIINFATIYGVSPFGLSQQAEIGIREAAAFIDRYFETYPGFRAYIDRTVNFAREHGYVETMLGRRRKVEDIDSTVTFRREGAERVAINTPIQGTSADMIKLAMIAIHAELAGRGLRSRLILQVHDELVLEVPEDEVAAVTALVKEKMEAALPLDVPVLVETGVGSSWADAH